MQGFLDLKKKKISYSILDGVSIYISSGKDIYIYLEYDLKCKSESLSCERMYILAKIYIK